MLGENWFKIKFSKIFSDSDLQNCTFYSVKTELYISKLYNDAYRLVSCTKE